MPVRDNDMDMDTDEDTGGLNIPEPVSIPAPIPEPLPIPEVQSGSKWSWIGSPDRPEAQDYSDGISDLFEVGDDLIDTSDLIDVDMEADIMDGDLSDLTEVSEEDIMGDPDTGQIPLDYRPDPPRMRPTPRYRRTGSERYNPPTSMRGLG